MSPRSEERAASLTQNRTPGERRSVTEWTVLTGLRNHRYDIGAKGSKPDDPGWHVCSCGWEGYWCDWQPHVAEQIIVALGPLLEAAGKLAASVADELTRCELTTDDGCERCPREPVAVRYEHGFIDIVCDDHASSAERRLAVVIRGFTGGTE